MPVQIVRFGGRALNPRSTPVCFLPAHASGSHTATRSSCICTSISSGIAFSATNTNIKIIGIMCVIPMVSIVFIISICSSALMRVCTIYSVIIGVSVCVILIIIPIVILIHMWISRPTLINNIAFLATKVQIAERQ